MVKIMKKISQQSKKWSTGLDRSKPVKKKRKITILWQKLTLTDFKIIRKHQNDHLASENGGN